MGTNKKIIKFKKLGPAAIIPARNHPTDAGLDLFSAEDVRINAFSRVTVSTLIACEFPEGYYGQIEGRSGLAAKNGLQPLAGICDTNYRGEIKVVLFNSNSVAYDIKKNDKIAQLLIRKNEIFDSVEVDEINDTDRGTKGFGSTK